VRNSERSLNLLLPSFLSRWRGRSNEDSARKVSLIPPPPHIFIVLVHEYLWQRWNLGRGCQFSPVINCRPKNSQNITFLTLILTGPSWVTSVIFYVKMPFNAQESKIEYWALDKAAMISILISLRLYPRYAG